MIQPEFLFGAHSTPTTEGYYLFVGLMVLSALANAVNLHLIHGLSKTIDPMVNMHYTHLGMLLLSSVLTNFAPKTVDHGLFTSNGAWVILTVLGLTLTGFLSQSLIFLANTFQKPSLIMPFGYLGVATGLLADLYLFGTQFTFLTTCGIFLTSGGLLSGYLLR